jgi:hypothetical protein
MAMLNEKAWEHVKSLLNDYDHSLVKKAIETYLDALEAGPRERTRPIIPNDPWLP